MENSIKVRKVWNEFYRKYLNLVRTEVEIISDPNFLVRILFER